MDEDELAAWEGRVLTTLLLDTHVWAWSLHRRSSHFGPRARQKWPKPQTILVSAISFFEVAQKVRLGKWPEMARYVERLPALLASQRGVAASLEAADCLHGGNDGLAASRPIRSLPGRVRAATAHPHRFGRRVFDAVVEREVRVERRRTPAARKNARPIAQPISSSPNSSQLSPSKRGKLHLTDRAEVGRRGVDLHARQKHRQFEVLEVGRLLHDVFARKVGAALLEHLNHRLRGAEGIGRVGVDELFRRHIFGDRRPAIALMPGSSFQRASVGSLP